MGPAALPAVSMQANSAAKILHHSKGSFRASLLIHRAPRREGRVVPRSCHLPLCLTAAGLCSSDNEHPDCLGEPT